MQHGLDYEVLKSDEMTKRYPGLKFDPTFQALYEPNGMVLKADKCLNALRVSDFFVF